MSDSENEDPFDEFGDGRDDAEVSPEALKKLRAEAPGVKFDEAVNELDEAVNELDDAVNEFDEPAATVRDDGSIARLVQLENPLLTSMDDDGGVNEFDDDSLTVMDPDALGKHDSSDDALGKESCPKCGVMVLAGYPKCPRCKTSLVPEKKTQEQPAAGGTSVIGRTVPWTLVLIAAILTGIIVYLSERDPKIPDLEQESEQPAENSERSGNTDASEPGDSKGTPPPSPREK